MRAVAGLALETGGDLEKLKAASYPNGGATVADQVTEMISKIGEKGVEITRFKGLGEMNAGELWETTMNPEKRTLLKVTIEDSQHAENVFERLMGKEVAPRKKFITDYAREVKNLDI